MENLTGGTPPVRYLPCVVPCKLYFEIALITKGGPGESTYTLSLYLYRKVFTYLADYGYSSAIGISIMLLNALFSLLIIKIRKK